MRIQLLGSATAIVAATAIAIGTGGANTGAATSVATSTSLSAEAALQPEEAARFAKQASFGPTPELISAIVAKKSIAAWLNEQFALSDSTYVDIAAKAVPGDFCSGLTGTPYNNCYRENFQATPVQMRFYSNALAKNDQLRQRVAFALSQVIVTSDLSSHTTAGLATFDQVLLSKTFGNYRDILKEVTLNAYMGHYLSLADSSKTQPNENYARELMQLFSVGTVLLNPDGTPQTDDAGTWIPAYSNTDVKEVARALTGWTYARLPGTTSLLSTTVDFSKPLIQSPTRFDTGAKTFLGKTVPANASQDANVDAVVDAMFNHPNTAPFISKRLIQQLTVANPTPAYVGRVAAVFANNGAGVRGDLKAVIRAIYLDDEARVVSQMPGKVKEPVLLATSLARAIGYQTDGYAFTTRDEAMGQAPFRAPSVFNFYPYDFPLPQGVGIISPVSKLMTTTTSVTRHNLIYDWTIEGDAARSEFKPNGAVTGSTGTQPDWSSWESNGTDDGKTLDRINLVLLNGTMTSAQRQSLVTAMAAIKNTDPAAQARKRAQMALYVVASSPLFQVDR